MYCYPYFNRSLFYYKLISMRDEGGGIMEEGLGKMALKFTKVNELLSYFNKFPRSASILILSVTINFLALFKDLRN